MMLKRKRNIGSKLKPTYVKKINALYKSDNYLEIDPDAAVTALIAQCSEVISALFTSTALIGRDVGKPSVYYDPHGVSEKEHRAANGIPIVSGRMELLAWLAAFESEPGHSHLHL